MVGSHPQAELAPRDVVVRHMKVSSTGTGPTTCGWMPVISTAPSCASASPRSTAGWRTAASTSAARPSRSLPASHYFIGGGAHRRVGQGLAPRSLFLRRDVLYRYPWGEPLGVELSAGGSCLRRAHRARSEPLPRAAQPAGAQVPARPSRRDLARQPGGRGPAGAQHLGPDHDALLWHRAGRRGSGGGRPRHRGAQGLTETARPQRGGTRGVQSAHGGETHRQVGLGEKESRGVHLRSDFPFTDDEHWRRHVSVDYDPDNDSTQVRVVGRAAGA